MIHRTETQYVAWLLLFDAIIQDAFIGKWETDNRYPNDLLIEHAMQINCQHA